MSALSFTKLFSSILRSTLWVGQPHHVRIVWVTMLAMADRNGIVASSIPGLASEAHVTLEEAEEALAVFLAPDKYSRTKDHEGRRIIELECGWQLVNYAKYRHVQSAEAEREATKKRMRALRQRKRNSVTVTECDECASASSSPSASVSDPEGMQGEGSPSSEVAKQEAMGKGRFAPSDLEPTEFQLVRCQELRLDAAALMRAFKNQEFNRDYSDWPRRFGKWIEDEKLKRETEQGKTTSGPRPVTLTFDEAMRRCP